MNNPTFELSDVKVLTVENRKYQSNGQDREFRGCRVLVGNAVLEFSISQSAFQSVKDVEGESDVVLVCELYTFGKSLSPAIRVTGVGK